MLAGGYSAVLQAGSRDDFRNEVVRFTQAMGFRTVSAMMVVDRSAGLSDFLAISNAPTGCEAVLEDASSMRLDPVMQHCRLHTFPIIWDQSTYTNQGLGDLWEAQARFGYCTGIAMALHLPEGRHFVLGVERDAPLPTDVGELKRLVADLQLFATYAQDAAQRVLTPALTLGDRPLLTPRELEALRWTMEGKTAWEVGAILGISERTAVLHVNNAMHKLNCTSKHQAVLKALRLGLIH
jgi:DNA-binding CsgD family transcriptional regulator